MALMAEANWTETQERFWLFLAVVGLILQVLRTHTAGMQKCG